MKKISLKNGAKYGDYQIPTVITNETIGFEDATEYRLDIINEEIEDLKTIGKTFVYNSEDLFAIETVFPDAIVIPHKEDGECFGYDVVTEKKQTVQKLASLF